MSRIQSLLAADQNQFKKPPAAALKPSHVVLKRGKPLRRSGKKGKLWSAIRAELKIRFQRCGITECEAKLPECWKDQALGFAHLDKRKHLTPEELWIVVLLCSPVCHDYFEKLSRAEMRKRLQAIIDARAKQP